MTGPVIHRFGDFELDVPAYALRWRGRRVRVEGRPMDLLMLLVERRGELVTRAEIIDRLWGSDVFVEVDIAMHFSCISSIQDGGMRANSPSRRHGITAVAMPG